MSSIAMPTLWTTRAGPWWRLPEWFTAGKAQEASSGKVKEKATNGKALENTATNTNCCCGCGACSLPSIAITSIVRFPSTTATVTTAVAHGYSTGNLVLITGATESQYNGSKTITVINTTQFTYTVSGSPATPAGGVEKLATKNGCANCTCTPSYLLVTFSGVTICTTCQYSAVCDFDDVKFDSGATIDGTFTVNVDTTLTCRWILNTTGSFTVRGYSSHNGTCITETGSTSALQIIVLRTSATQWTLLAKWTGNIGNPDISSGEFFSGTYTAESMDCLSEFTFSNSFTACNACPSGGHVSVHAHSGSVTVTPCG